RHEPGGSSQVGTSGPSSNSSRVAPDDEDLQVGQLFETKKDLQEAVHRLALKYNFEFKVKKSNKSLLTVACVEDSCNWRLRATKMDTNECFVIRKYLREHTCEVGILRNDHRQARAWFIGRQIMHKYQDPRTIYRPSDIINDVRREYGVVMSYQKAWKAKECALEDLMGSAEESYAKLARDIFAAGTDTSAITTEWALAELINHPNILRKAQHEINSVVGKKRLVEESDISNLPYLQAIVKETLRLHPTGPLIVRESSDDCNVAGYHIPAKTRLFVNVWAIGRDPEHWENPLEFRPERFLNEDGNLKAQLDVRGQHYHLLPFGSGRRGCPGTSLALLVVQTTLAAMIQCFEWKVEGNGTVNMEEGPGLTLPKAHPLICFPVARLNPIPSM
ncbi:cytochrome P450 93A3-like, partial [Olea europaea subsp. europaea]